MDDVVRLQVIAGLRWCCEVVSGKQFTDDDAERVAKTCAWVRLVTKDADDVQQWLARQLAFAIEELLTSLMACAGGVDELRGDVQRDVQHWRTAMQDFATELHFDG